MADALPTSFSKTIDIRDAESTTTTTGTTTVAGVLTTDNTAAYTPTANYHPATKLYVDGSVTDYVYRVEDYGAVGYTTDPGASRTYSTTAIQSAVDAVTDSGRGGVVLFKNKTYYTDAAINVIDTPGIEFRGPGGHRVMYRLDANNEDIGAIATIHQKTEAEHIFAIQRGVASVAHPSTRFVNLRLRGDVDNHATSGFANGSLAAGIFVDDSNEWTYNLDLDNVMIFRKMYGIRGNIKPGATSYGMGFVNVKNTMIRACWWGFYSDNSSNTTIRILNSDIRFCGMYSNTEADYDATVNGGGVWLKKCSNLQISNCILESNCTSIRLYNCWSVDLDNNYYEDLGTAAINLELCKGVTARVAYGGMKSATDPANLARLEDCDTVDLTGWVSRGSDATWGQIGVRLIDSGGNTNIRSDIQNAVDDLNRDAALELHYRFDEETGAIAYDTSGNQRHGTLTNITFDVEGVAGKFGGGIDRDAASEKITLQPLRLPDADQTIAGWLKAASDGSVTSCYIVSSRNTTDGGLSLFINGETLQAFIGTTGQASFTASAWDQDAAYHHFACVYTKDEDVFADGTIDYYYDGVYRNSDTALTGTWHDPADPAADVATQIFERIGTTSTADVSADDIRIYSRALSAAEIALLYSGPF